MRMAPAAMWMACIDEPQKRLTVAPPPMSGSPARKPTSRADVQSLLALGEGAAEDDVLDLGALDAGALDQARDDCGGHVVGAHLGQLALSRRR